MRKLFQKLTHWLQQKPYTKAMYITAIATIVMASLSGVMCFTLLQNNKALQMTAESLAQNQEALELARKSLQNNEQALRLTNESIDIQRKEFKLRNRPIVVIRNVHFGGSGKSTEGELYPASISFELTNISDVPANKMLIISSASLNGRLVKSTIIGSESLKENIGATSLPRDHKTQGALLIDQSVVDMAMRNSAKLNVVFDVTYSGMLGEVNDAYKTHVEMQYEPAEKSFDIERSFFQ